MLNTIKEVGRPVKNFKNLYEISTLGRLSNYRKMLKFFKNNSGYYCVKLSKNTKKYHRLVHRLVAEAFIPNPDNKPYVNHKDGNKLNNRVDNLEWCTASENMLHAVKEGLHAPKGYARGFKRKTAASKYHNVSWDKNRNKWSACVGITNGKTHQKRFDDEVEAAKYVDYLLDLLNITDRPKNF